MARKKGVPVKDEKTVPQKVARKELIAGGGKEARRRALISGGSDDPVMAGQGAALPRSTKSAGVLTRNVRGSAPTRRGDKSAGAKDKRTIDFKRQEKSKLDIKDPKDRKFLEKKERERMRGEKSGKAKVGAKVKFMYYKKEREGKIVDIKMKKGVPRQMSVDVVGMGRINTDIKNII